MGAEISDLLYISRTSLPSLFSDAPGPVRVAPQPPEPLKRHQHNAVVSDLTKTALQALVEHRPSHVIFDFIDERFDLIAAGDGLVTHSWELEVSGYLAQPTFADRRGTPRLSPGCDLLWALALEELAGFVAATPLRDATLILHQSHWADRYLDEDGVAGDLADTLELMPGCPASRAEHNRLLDRYQTAFRERFPQAATVFTPTDLQVADARHRWGLSPFHYQDAYYAEIWRQLRVLGV